MLAARPPSLSSSPLLAAACSDSASTLVLGPEKRCAPRGRVSGPGRGEEPASGANYWPSLSFSEALSG